MPIALAPLNEELTVVKVLLDEKNKKHLESLGILPNVIDFISDYLYPPFFRVNRAFTWPLYL